MEENGNGPILRSPLKTGWGGGGDERLGRQGQTTSLVLIFVNLHTSICEPAPEMVRTGLAREERGNVRVNAGRGSK